MSDGRSLISMLARVRRRLRLLAAAQGAVAAATVAALGLALGFLIVRAQAGVQGGAIARAGGVAALGLGLVGFGAGVGALWGALRKIPLERCARLVDRALDGQDRVLSALTFAGADGGRRTDGPGAAFAAAVIRDALGRAAGVAPASAVPLRRPAGLLDLALGVAVVALAALVPSAARGSRAPARPTEAAAKERGFRLDESALDAEREEAAAAQRAATALADARLETLAREMAAVLAAIDAGGLPKGELLERLADLQRRSEEAAGDAETLQRQLARAGQALRTGQPTREAGRAIEAADPAATEKALAALAARAAEARDAERSGIAADLERAGEQARAAVPPAAQAPGPAGAPPAAATGSAKAGATPNDGATTEERQRRLARDGEPRAATGAAANRGARDDERRLERLDQNLKDAAAACRANPEACRRQLDQAAKDLPRMERQANSTESRRRLAQAVRQLRERLRREGTNPGDSARQKAERRFAREARGEQIEAEGDLPASGGDSASAGDKDGTDRGESGSPGAGASAAQAGRQEDESGAGAGAGRAPSAGGGGTADSDSGEAGAEPSGPGNGFGTQNGGDPLGAPGAMAARGRAREARIAGSSGPSRSEVIQAAAKRGFAHARYGAVFDDYHAAVEESLDAAEVPPGQRYVVRRYFQLIRPVPARARTTALPAAPPSSSPAPAPASSSSAPSPAPR